MVQTLLGIMRKVTNLEAYITRLHVEYMNIVIIITLSGTSTLYGCTTREGAGRQVIDDSPGQIVLLAAPGFKGLASAADRPLHGVDNVTDGRLSIGLRSEQLKS